MVRTTDTINKIAYQKEEFSFREIDKVAPLIFEKELKNVKGLYHGAKDDLLKIFQSITNNEDFSVDPILKYIKEFVSSIQKETDTWNHLLYKEEKESDITTHTVIHSLNTAVVAIRVGIRLKLYDDKLETLATLAFFHDVGMLMMPPDIIKKNGKLSPEEFSLIKKHPEYGSKILRKLGEKYSHIADEVYQEHERYDGSGYPAGLKQDDIFDYSLIIGISDMYAALVHTRPYRPRYLPFDAVKHVIATAKNQFPNDIIKALVNEFSTFPMGICVTLNSKEVGRVIATNKLAPLRPVVEILYDVNGNKLEKPKSVDMTKHHLLQVVSAYFEEEGQN